ncbi:MAG: type II toxin-antitoxin system RelE/ParE family toxin [Clostridiales bacterium]|nr:type II toxin-antitoxin system RelE/ParE family toxin [Clostridiales bacterium]
MTQYKIFVTSDAYRDMDEIFMYVSEKLQVPDTAANLVERIYAGLNSLSSMPERYPLSRDTFLAKQGFCLLRVSNYLVFYVVENTAKRVIIHRVIYGKRDYIKLFLPDG